MKTEHTISKLNLQTPIGLIKIKSCQKGLHWISCGSSPERDGGPEEVVDIKQPYRSSDKSHIPVFEWMREYFGLSDKPNPSLVKEPGNYPPICWDGLGKTEFETKVLTTAVESIKFGQTISYGQLAALVNNHRASRAVGTALKYNPIHIIIPCHRIVRSDGSVGKYAGGANVKEWLINFEKGTLF